MYWCLAVPPTWHLLFQPEISLTSECVNICGWRTIAAETKIRRFADIDFNISKRVCFDSSVTEICWIQLTTNQLWCRAWASYQIRKIAVCACAGNAGNVFPHHRFRRKPLVSDPGMHHGTCVTHVPWCMSGSLTCGGGENVPGIPGACAPAILRIWQEAHGLFWMAWRRAGITWMNKLDLLHERIYASTGFSALKKWACHVSHKPSHFGSTARYNMLHCIHEIINCNNKNEKNIRVFGI